MANELLTTSLGDILASEALSGIVEMALADRGALPNHPALIEATGLEGRGSASIKASSVGLQGYDLLASTAEGSSIANTALTDSSVNLTIGKYGKVYTASSLARIVEGTGTLGLQAFALDAVMSAASTLLYIVAQLMDNFATVKGTSGANASFQNFLDCITALEIAKVRGPLLSILHAQQWADIRSDVATASGGAIQWNGGSQVMIDAMKGIGWQGQFAGVDVYTTIHTLNDGTDVFGGMFGRGAIVYGWASPSAVDLTSDQVVLGGKILFERSRSALADTTSYATHIYAGVVELIDLAGVTLRTDAP
jgi:hypothetical protein